ncbi:MAG TPA: DUF4115 domain-containing protein [Geminicoccaceae bacterium]|nr:DUF4115 domain-containing protein [Geminicoccus sp.]HMU50692.1 DUF4115 domain-containing protein [Geminicoccaceae bacterium]
MISRRPRRPSLSSTGSDGSLVRIGGELRAARLARREDLYDIADVLRIRPVYLEGLESGDIGVMPGRPYALGFLKSYADYLGLDGQALVAEAKGSGGAARPDPALVYRMPVDERRRPTKVLGAVSIVAAVLVYAGWHGYSSGQLDLDDRIAGLPLQIGEVAVDLVAGDLPAPAPTAAPAPQVSVAGPSAAIAMMPSTGDLDALRLLAPDASAEPGAAMAAARPTVRDVTSAQAAERLPAVTMAQVQPATAGAMLAALDESPTDGLAQTFAAGDGARILLVARESSWIQVRSRARDYVRTRTLQTGDRMFLPNRDDLSLWTGNAGGLELHVDGKSVGVLGRRGDVLRELALDPEGLLRRTTMR